ncbi:MAG: hypothetical protein H7256_13560 [Bdellovibrio sp.]|nr:hypothetical protein [Bdellovibrio sp.]
MNRLLIGLLLISGTAQAATILQTKAKSAIVQVSDSEVNDLQLSAGQSIQFSAGGATIQASIVKLIKNKILIKSDTDLTGQQNANVDISIPLGSPTAQAAAPQQQAGVAPRKVVMKDRAFVNKSTMSKKPWMAGVNVKYVNGSSKIKFSQAVGTATIETSYSFPVTGFDLSGVGFYYFGPWGAGAEVEYATLKGSDSGNTATITQMQLNALGEYKINPKITAGASLTIASNYKASDSVGNDSSLNGMLGFGVFGTYQVTPNIRALVEYKTMNYKLDSNTVSTSDIRIGAGYYF